MYSELTGRPVKMWTNVKVLIVRTLVLIHQVKLDNGYRIYMDIMTGENLSSI